MGSLTKQTVRPIILPPGLVPDDPAPDEYLDLDSLTDDQLMLACANSNVASVSLRLHPNERWALIRVCGVWATCKSCRTRTRASSA